MILYLLPFLAAFTGWLLFRISQSIFFSRSATAPLTLISLLRKGKPRMAAEIGSIAAGYLESNKLSDRIDTSQAMAAIKPVLAQHIDEFLEVKLVKQFPMIGMLGGSGLIDQIRGSLLAEMELLLPEILQRYSDQLLSALEPEKLIGNELNRIPDYRLYQWLAPRLWPFSIKMQFAGAIFGFVIGLCLSLAVILFYP